MRSIRRTAASRRVRRNSSEGRNEVEPNWLPLENRVGTYRCVGFMFMARLNGINCYKHGIARTYLNLDDDGNCYVPGETGTYVRADWQTELHKLEACLAKLGSSLTTPYDDEFIARKRKALQEQGISLLTISVEPQKTNIH